jgi:YidC/Oxa1 family membrane protein insertase
MILGVGREFEVIYTFFGDGYEFKYEINTIGLDDAWVRPDAEIYWKGGLAYTEPDSAQDIWYSKAYVYYSGDVLEKMKLNTKETESEGLTSGQTMWGSVRTKYFMVALIPDGGMGTGAWMESEFDSTYVGKFHPNKLGVGVKIPLNGGNPSLPVKVYIGPLDSELLDVVDNTLRLAMTWGAGIKFLDGIVSPISRAVLWGLKGIHKFVPNYGICVILFSIIIKIVIWPLTRKSYQSMAAMQRLQPKMQALRDKYGKDQQRLQREIMQLYKTEKVNPMGGCLPMLLQMPLLYALFVIFRSTIEFRGAPFMFWIQDLSLPDAIMQLPFSLPLYGAHIAVLPIVMGITTFYQSKATMTDPNQKMLLYFMPIFLTLIFNQFPSGLTLYYTLFNLWTLLQQKYTASRFSDPAGTVKPPPMK